MMRRMPAEGVKDQRQQILSGVVETLLRDLRDGNGDRDRRRQVEEWMRTLAEKFGSRGGLRKADRREVKVGTLGR